jgi:iron complex outermembrane receptor protein
VGSKVERLTQTGWHLQPTLRALWNANARQSVWGAISRVVRTPSIVERGMVVDLFTAPGPMPIVGQLSGNPDLQEESLEAYEAGYRWTTSAVSLDLTGYVNQYAGAVTLWTGAPRFFGGPGGPYLLLPMMLTNDSNVSTAGGEALVTISASPRWRIVGGYNLFTWQSRLRPDAIATAPTSSLNTPRHQFTARSLFALPHGVDFDTTLYRVGAIETGHVPAYTRIDARLGWRVWSALDLSVLARNVLDSRHAEYGFQDAAVLFGRARRQLSVTTTWRF